MATRLRRLQVTPPSQEVRDWIDEVARLTLSPSPASTVSSLLSAMRDLMRLELRRVPLSEREADCLADILGGSIVTIGPLLGPILYAEVANAFQLAGDGVSSYGAHHGIDQDALLAKLRGIGPSADLALRLAFARWWSMADGERGPSSARPVHQRLDLRGPVGHSPEDQGRSKCM
jgi:hypothetical protein